LTTRQAAAPSKKIVSLRFKAFIRLMLDIMTTTINKKAATVSQFSAFGGQPSAWPFTDLL
jgi:hypothetical protein